MNKLSENGSKFFRFNEKEIKYHKQSKMIKNIKTLPSMTFN
ncbi:unnamed protein product [Paramecium pentaurelia]|uniref:Uncharacterized protein n=1 Tax=Paramecium pentaurelia TaxID=43138 RepID=A0A8S1S2N4_9CILI|nr:unnamed protein product [Paramecium pentaurelia]